MHVMMMMMMMMMMMTTRLQIVPTRREQKTNGCNQEFDRVNNYEALVEFCLLCLTDDEAATHQNGKLSQNLRNPQIKIR
jgi:hypothetical protein